MTLERIVPFSFGVMLLVTILYLLINWCSNVKGNAIHDKRHELDVIANTVHDSGTVFNTGNKNINITNSSGSGHHSRNTGRNSSSSDTGEFKFGPPCSSKKGYSYPPCLTNGYSGDFGEDVIQHGDLINNPLNAPGQQTPRLDLRIITADLVPNYAVCITVFNMEHVIHRNLLSLLNTLTGML